MHGLSIFIPFLVFSGATLVFIDVRVLYAITLLVFLLNIEKILKMRMERKVLFLLLAPSIVLSLAMSVQMLLGISSPYFFSFLMSMVVFQMIVFLGYCQNSASGLRKNIAFLLILSCLAIAFCALFRSSGFSMSISTIGLRGLNETMFVIVAVYSLSVVFLEKRRVVLFLTGIFFIGLTIYLSARAATVLFLMCMVFLLFRRLRTIGYFSSLFFLLMFFLLSFSVLVSSDSISDKFRVAFIANSFNLFIDNPVAGVGFSNTNFSNQAILPGVIEENDSYKKVRGWIPNTHNFYFQSLSDFGLFGMLVFFLFMFGDRINGSKNRFIPIWILLAYSFFISSLVVPILWYVYGMMFRYYEMEKKKQMQLRIYHQ